MGWLSRFRSWRRSFRRRIRRYIYRRRRTYRRRRRRFSIRRIFRRTRRVIGNVHRKISHKGSRIIRRLTVWRRGKTITGKTKSWFRRKANWIRKTLRKLYTGFTRHGRAKYVLWKRGIKKVIGAPKKIFRGLSTRIRRRISWLTRKIRGRNLVNRAKTALRKIGKIIALPAIALGGLLAKKKLEEKRIEKREEKPPEKPPIIKPEEIPQEILQDPAQFVKNTMADFQEVLQEPAKITKKPRVLIAIALFALVAFYFWRKKK